MAPQEAKPARHSSLGEGRDAEAVGGRDQLLALRRQRERARAPGRPGGGAEQGRVSWPSPCAEQLVQVGRRLHLVLVRGDFATLVAGADPDNDQSGRYFSRRVIAAIRASARSSAEREVSCQAGAGF
ncbi:hypothetical protein GCM10020229_54300 [Kitasatospora albolonga]